MVKGVHKKIIEVNHTGSDYFEKAVFYLKPGVSQLPPQVADAAAQMLMQESGLRKRRKMSRFWLLLFGSSAVILFMGLLFAGLFL